MVRAIVLTKEKKKIFGIFFSHMLTPPFICISCLGKYTFNINVLTRRREYGTYLATAHRHRRRIKMQKRDE